MLPIQDGMLCGHPGHYPVMSSFILKEKIDGDIHPLTDFRGWECVPPPESLLLWDAGLVLLVW